VETTWSWSCNERLAVIIPGPWYRKRVPGWIKACVNYNGRSSAEFACAADGHLAAGHDWVFEQSTFLSREVRCVAFTVRGVFPFGAESARN